MSRALNDALKKLLTKWRKPRGKGISLLAQTTVDGEDYLLIRRPIPDVKSLTETECAISFLVGRGLTNKEVAARLGLSQFTVAAHLQNIFKKLKVDSRNAVGLQIFTQR